ncbi:hypothetical protein FACS1894132_02670 [Clostridia bacterium]|nr:hypothetical protein FACS1894132_02670 [Clostridia bacterium]
MFAKVSEMITQALEDGERISREDRELYKFGIKNGLSILLNLATTVIIGIIYSMLWQAILFIVAYIPLRSYAGGWHAKTPLRCYFSSIGILCILLSVLKWINISTSSLLIIIIVSILIICIFAPVEDFNKPLDNQESKIYRIRTRLVLIIELFIIALFYLLNIKQVSELLALTIFIETVLLVMGYIKLKK